MVRLLGLSQQVDELHKLAGILGLRLPLVFGNDDLPAQDIHRADVGVLGHQLFLLVHVADTVAEAAALVVAAFFHRVGGGDVAGFAKQVCVVRTHGRRVFHRLVGPIPAANLDVGVFDLDVAVVVRLGRVGVGSQRDRADPHHRVVETAFNRGLHHRHHVRRLTRITRQQLLGIEHRLLVVFAAAQLHGVEHPQLLPAAGLSPHGDIAQRLMRRHGLGIDSQPLEIHLDGVVVVSCSGDGLPPLKEGVGLLLVFFGNQSITFWEIWHCHFLFCWDPRKRL